MKEPAWMTTARNYLGLTEIPGVATAPVIKKWLVGLKAWWTDDETPWCGVFVAQCLHENGVDRPKNWFRALAWLDWGIPISQPMVGCVVVYARKGGGHVGFVVGRDEKGRVLTLGGNQGNRVSIAPFDSTRVVGYRWPVSVPVLNPTAGLPVLASNGQPSSTQEA
jgi:uncharacterized protein (TIGR02594 family)